MGRTWSPAAVKAFFDSNVLLYATIMAPGELAKRDIARDVLDKPGTISVQVLNEFVWQSTRTGRENRFSRDAARRATERWRSFAIQPLDLPVFDLTWDVAARTNYRWRDCLIVAAALVAGCDVLYTEDMQHGRIIDGLRIENPFRDLG